MNDDQRQRIEKMEHTFNDISVALKNLEQTLTQWKEKMSLYDEIVNYYTGEEWMIDYDDSNKADFPSYEELPHCILSEDAIYDEMVRYREIAIRMLKLATEMIEQ